MTKPNMAAKEYLGQAFHIDKSIHSKLEQVMALRSLATKATTTLSDMPRSDTPSHSRMEDIILKIVALESEVNDDIDRLIDLKREIGEALKMLTKPEHQLLLELRYLCFKPWEEIAVAMHYSIQHTFRIHGSALKAFDDLLMRVHVIV